MRTASGISCKGWWHTNGENGYCVPTRICLPGSAIRLPPSPNSSPENQLEVMRQYAARTVWKSSGVLGSQRSGLNIAGREGLNRLMSDVENKQANFSALLVYDVSRWGRFQDVDESAYYEYVLKRAGIRVHYCAEQFENDGTYDLPCSSVETLDGRGIQPGVMGQGIFGSMPPDRIGFRQGGPAGYGLRRQLIDRDRNPKGLLDRGDEKPSDRPGYSIPGPEGEIETVQQDLRSVRRARKNGTRDHGNPERARRSRRTWASVDTRDSPSIVDQPEIYRGKHQIDAPSS